MTNTELTYSAYIFTIYMNDVAYNTEHNQDGTTTVTTAFSVARFDRHEKLIVAIFAR